MDAEEVFLNCSNLTLGQYTALVLTRSLTGVAGCVVSLSLLVIVLLIAKKKAWETRLVERIYFTNILYTLLYCIVAIAAVNYSHPPSQESAWCGAMGFLLHYTGTLVVVQYCALAFAIMLQIVRSLRNGNNSIGPRKVKPGEVLLYLILFLCPLLNSWEPFLPQLPSYGNYGPLCWFRLDLTDNCTANTLDVRFLQAIPFAFVSLAYCVTFTISLFTVCGLYFQTCCTTTSGSNICKFVPTLVVLTVITFVMMTWFIVSALPSKSLSDIRSYSTWLENVTATLAATIGVLVAVGVYIHFPTELCRHCWAAFQQARGQQTETTPLMPHSRSHCINNPTATNFSPSHSPVTTNRSSTT